MEPTAEALSKIRTFSFRVSSCGVSATAAATAAAAAAAAAAGGGGGGAAANGNGSEEKLVRVNELLNPDFGLYVWPSAIFFALHLAASSPQICTRRTVVELGAGTGLVGIVCALCGAERVWLTDHASNTCVLDNLQRTLKLNDLGPVRLLILKYTHTYIHVQGAACTMPLHGLPRLKCV